MIFNIELPKKLNKINYFKKEEKGCTLYSYNGVLGNSFYIIANYPELEIEKDFTIVDSTLNAIVKLNPNVEVKLNEKTIVAASAKGKYTGKYVENNFVAPYMEYKDNTIINLDILNKASSFSSSNEKKPILTGVNVNQNGVIIATDSYKVYRYNDNSNNVEDPTSITIPSSLIKLAYSVFDNKKLDLYFNKNTFCIKDDNIMLVGQLLDGNFPNVNAIFNQLNQEPCVINKEELLEAIDFTKITGANVDIKKTPLYAILSENKFVGQSDEKFEKEINYIGENVVFDALFLETVLKAFDNNDIKMSTLKKERGSMSKFTSDNDLKEEIVLLGIVREE